MLDLVLAFALSGTPSAPPPPPPAITAKLGQEDGKPEIIATVTVDGKPLPSAGVSFQLVRSFGSLTLGEDTTLEDGTAAVSFPKELGLDAEGGWTVKVALTSPEAFQGQETVVRIPPPAVSTPLPAAPPRELWARRAPWSLLAAILALMASVWGAYGFAAYQLFHIRKGGQDA